MKKSLLYTSLVLLSSTTLLHADQPDSTQPQPVTPLYNSPGRPEVKHGANLFITADYLLWQANEQNVTAWENGGFDTPIGTNAVQGKFQSPEFSWESGARVGIGYNIPHDQWDLSLTWTWFEDHGKKHATAPSSSPLFSSVSSPLYNIRAGQGSTHLRINLNTIDLELGKEFYVSKWFTLRPFAGMRTAWVHQHWKTTFQNIYSINTLSNINTFTDLLKQHFWGIGPRFGLNLEFGWCCGLSIFSNAALDVLYGFYKNTFKEKTLSNTGVKTLNDSSKRGKHCEEFILGTQLGLRWDYMFSQDRFHIRLQTGWEHHVFLDHNNFYNFTQGTASTVDAYGGNLGFQGWFLSGRFDF
jgi:hypothetical protein